MCNKYTLTVGSENLKSQLLVDICNSTALSEQKIDPDKLTGIMPNDNAPALMLSNSQPIAVSMQWGFTTKSGKLIINARSETIKDRLLFKNLADHQRCALPASGYYEWRDADHLRHFIRRRDKQDFYLAGLYRSDERSVLHFVVLTRPAFGPHARIHSRMPCLLHSRQDARKWLYGALSVEELIRGADETLDIEVQGLDQLMMSFDD